MDTVNFYTKSDWERRVTETLQAGDERSEFERDRNRILHSAAFRRLQGKTQLLGIGQSDFFRTRLTHSLEVAQIAKGVGLRLRRFHEVLVDLDLLEAASLAHDIGHPPFGHTGEETLHELMKDHGGFEANAQNLRILTQLEQKSREYRGLNLSRATLDAVLKYKKHLTADSPKGYYPEDNSLVAWVVADGDPKEPSLECQIMDWSDDIAYSVHDLEDGLHAGLINIRRILRHREEIVNAAQKEASDKFGLSVTSNLVDELIKQIRDEYEDFLEPPYKETERKAARKTLTSVLIGEFIRGSDSEKVNTSAVSTRYGYRLRVSVAQRLKCIMLKNIAWVLMINDERVLALRVKAAHIIRQLFQAFFKEPNASKLLPDDFEEMYSSATSDSERARVIADFIAGMTDEYAERVYTTLFLPGSTPVLGTY